MNLNPLNYYALDVEQDFDTEKNIPIVVITFTPRKNRFGHFHIEMISNALKNYLNGFMIF